ncbi:class I SAM-dependent methyltransferase [Salinibaculum rarum]|uniref:class I SAM-dependent methyltransferase n=1 Tax=Salinibaculum rarum TaxID=3058903 RepID=UPI00265F85FD|nr:class I SAM-dependent methyltransferase [Salinibaculum sp. KK48]
MTDGDDGAGDHRSPTRIREVYDDIADHFSKTREYAWPEVEEFLADASGERGLDVGCGNGRHTELLAAHVDRAVGADVSRGLLTSARDRMEDRDWRGALVQGDAAALPFATDTFDVGIYVATLHHLPTRERRRRSLDELARVLCDGGRALVSAWSTAHDRFDAPADAETGFDTTVDWTLPGGETVPRFYHIYAPAEFEADLESSALTVASVRISSGNCYADVRA